jgi:hypothetical protein
MVMVGLVGDLRVEWVRDMGKSSWEDGKAETTGREGRTKRERGRLVDGRQPSDRRDLFGFLLR